MNRGAPAGGSIVGQVSEGANGFRLASGEAPAAGTYDFVVQDGTTTIGRGHYALSGGGLPVEYAGQITFGEGGALMEWTNASGHYRPAAGFAGNAGLPLGAFRAVQFPVLVGAPHVPMFRNP